MKNQEMTFEQLNQYEKSTLIEIILTQASVLKQLQEQMKKQVERLEELERSVARQSAPFRRGDKMLKTEEDKKRSGRAVGHEGSFRPVPEVVDFDEEVKLEKCPLCGGEVGDLEMVEQYVEEFPHVRPVVYRLRTWRGKCKCCRKEVCSRHPMQVSEASGKAGVHLGLNAQRWCVSLPFEFGLSKRKSCRLLKRLMGLSISCGGLTLLGHRNAGKLQPDYDQILLDLRKSSSMHSDETSWYVGNPKAWLWVFANATSTLYQVDKHRNRAVIEAVLGDNFTGTLVSDCLVVYENLCVKQQKCYAHHLKAVRQKEQARKETLEKEADEEQALAFFEQVRQLLKTAQHVKEHFRQQQISQNEFEQVCLKLEHDADELLLPVRTNEFEEKLANRLRKQRKHLFTFLYEQEVDATNNLAERQLRPAVISRKISCGNKTDKGAATWQTITSVIVTANQQQNDFLEIINKRVALSKPQPIWALPR